MIEDLGNQDQMTFLADYLFRAGATVVPMRPVGLSAERSRARQRRRRRHVHRRLEQQHRRRLLRRRGRRAVSLRVDVGDGNRVRAATGRRSPTPASIRSTRGRDRGSDRAADQLYRVNHAGGITEVTVNHRRVGNGLVYLGTYYFEAGTGGYVEISNRSSEAGRVVIADMIRFGNGMGDIDRGGGVSGRARRRGGALLDQVARRPLAGHPGERVPRRRRSIATRRFGVARATRST